MTIAIDAMGGDFAPEEIVKGAVAAAELVHGDIILVGVPSHIERFLPSPCPRRLLIHAATETIEMGEPPLDALRRKPNSSLPLAASLVKSGDAQAMISAGNTGATVAAALLAWKRAPGVSRPAIGSMFPNAHGGFLLLDAGASPDVAPENLLEFAIMGLAYAERVMGRKDPKAYLLNIGEEPGKGNAFVKKAYERLEGFEWFGGNIEGNQLFRRQCDVVVCDAFVGNVVLKTSEGVAEYISQAMRERIMSSKLAQVGYLMVQNVLKQFRKQLDYAEYGGSPLLGLNGLCVVCHGRSNAKAIKNAIVQAQRAIDGDLVSTLQQAFAGRTA